MNNTSNFFLLAVIYSWVLLPVSGQNSDSVKLAEQYYQLGMDTYDFTHRKQAKESFVLAVNYNPNHAKAQFMAGKSIMLTVHKEEALPYFLKAIELDNKVDEDVFYYIGLAYHHTNQYDKAIDYYQLHRKKLARSLDFDRANQINIIDRKIFECYNAKVFESNPMDVSITLLSKNINSEFPDYAPAISADESTLVFTSRRPENVNPNIADDHEYYEDIFISRKVDGVFQKANNIGEPINTRFHNASITLSPDGTELLLYRSNNGGDIYKSDLQLDGSWSDPISMPGQINTEHLENSASLTEDFQTLYFTSNRPGGYGGTDIYVSQIGKTGLWGAPELLGPEINTEMDEDGVFISSNGNHLYFSSNGHAGMGGLDIYRAEWDQKTGKFVNPVNLGYPINSVENDIYFSISGDEQTGYYSSVKSETFGEQDIYKIDLSQFEPVYIDEIINMEDTKDPVVKIPVNEKIYMSLSVTDIDTKNPITSDIEVSIGKSRGKIIDSNTETGTYKVEFYHHIDSLDEYRIKVSHPEYQAAEFPVYVAGKGNEGFQISERIAMIPQQDAEVPSTEIVHSGGGIFDISFEFDSDIPKSTEGINYLGLMMLYDENLKVEIMGHTDSSGDEAYNKDLSLKRANAIKNHLIGMGIAKDRITTYGYGEERPVYSNETRIGRILNRRIEFNLINENNGKMTDSLTDSEVER